MLYIGILLYVLLGYRTCVEGCQKKNYGDEKIVCVCNSTYCDTIPKVEKVDRPQFILYTSSKAGLRFEKSAGRFTTSNQLYKNQITVNSKEKYQEILGWGGAFTDTTGFNILSLRPEAQNYLLQSYFSEDGIEYSLCRVPIGGTDFSIRGYSYDDGESDPNILNFQLAQEDFQFKIPFIKNALNLTNNNLQLFASAWTAPKWMKSNGAYAGVGFLLKNMYQPWADYHLKFLDKYKENEINFWGITTGNEPSLGFVPFNKINSVGWTPGDMATWIKNNLGPTIKNSNHSSIKMIILDDQRLLLPWFVNTAMREKNVQNYIDGIAVHWYYDNLVPPTILEITHNNFPDKFILATEACAGSKLGEVHVDLGSWDRGESYADDIIQDINNWVGGWVDWNMALNLNGGPTYIENYVDSPIIVNASAGEFYKQPMFYNLGHFSKFVPKGSVRVLSTTFDKEVPVAAFQRPDNGTVVVILNKKDQDVPVVVVDDFVGTTEITVSKKSITTMLYW